MSWVSRILGEIQENLGLGGELPAPDLSRIRPYTEAVQRSEPFDGHAFISHFHKGKKHLAYVAARHEVGPNDNETFKAVREAMEKFPPSFLIIEGVETMRGESPEFYQKIAQNAAEKGFASIAEPEYSAYQAMRKNIPFIGGEPPDLEIFAQMEGKGYSQKDTAAFYLLRSLPHSIARGEINAENFDEKAKDYLDNLRYYRERATPPEQRLTVPEFKQWYEKHNDVPGRNFMDIGTQALAPMATADATYFNRMSAATGEIREKHLDTLIGETLQKHDRVMVVYGSGHLAQSRAVFEGMFGPAENVRPGGASR